MAHSLALGAEFLWVIRICVSLFFLSSALGKIRNIQTFIQGVINYQILPKRIATIFGWTLPWIEMAVGLALVFGVALPVAGFVGSVLIISFIIAVVINLTRGRLIQCNCFGFAGTRTISWGTVARNVLLLGLTVAVTTLSFILSSTGHRPNFLEIDISLLSSADSVIPLLLLLGFCVVAISLTEWAVDIYSRVNHLKEALSGD
jgi:uncharacterized membrane protein YphA (DoxX/SURF4 family)